MPAVWQRCEVCDFTGPDLSPWTTARRDFHRALHHFGRTYVEALRIPQIAAWLNRKIT